MDVERSELTEFLKFSHARIITGPLQDASGFGNAAKEQVVVHVGKKKRSVCSPSFWFVG